jgi:hypothetical protein
MGLFGSRPTAEIHLDPIDKPFYGPGETIIGTVVLENKKQISVACIDLSCIGELFYQRTEYIGGADGGQTVVVDEHLSFFVAHKDLVSSLLNRFLTKVSYSSDSFHCSEKKILFIGKDRIISRNLSVAIFVPSRSTLTAFIGGGSREKTSVHSIFAESFLLWSPAISESSCSNFNHGHSTGWITASPSPD